MPTGLSRRISSAYGTQELGRCERRPVVGGEYAVGSAGRSVCVAATAGLVSGCRVETVAFILDVARRTGCSRA